MSLCISCMSCGDYTPAPGTLSARGKNNTRGTACGNRACRSACRFQNQVADMLRICPSLLCRWKTKSDKFQELILDNPRMKRMHAGRKVLFPKCEDLLYQSFLERRLLYGLPVDHYWLRAKFLDILNEHKPPHYMTARLSNGWLCGFVLRYNISSRMKTDKKSKSVEERIDMIRQFHLDLKLFLSDGVQKCPMYGRYHWQ